jgi:hypothetical protein
MESAAVTKKNFLLRVCVREYDNHSDCSSRMTACQSNAGTGGAGFWPFLAAQQICHDAFKQSDIFLACAAGHHARVVTEGDDAVAEEGTLEAVLDVVI